MHFGEAASSSKSYYGSNHLQLLWWHQLVNRVLLSQCENFSIFVSLRFYVKSILAKLEPQNCHCDTIRTFVKDNRIFVNG